MVQVNTAVMRRNVEEMAGIAALLKRLGVHVWEVFFLVHVGRGASVEELDPASCEDVCHFLFDAARYGFVVRTVEGPFFRRVVNARAADARRRRSGAALPPRPPLRPPVARALGEPRRADDAPQGDERRHARRQRHPLRRPRRRRLPRRLSPPSRSATCASRTSSTSTNPTRCSRAIRRAEFTGRCGACEMRELCGGSRSRAYAAFGDPLAEDPACAYVPAGYEGHAARPRVHLA